MKTELQYQENLVQEVDSQYTVIFRSSSLTKPRPFGIQIKAFAPRTPALVIDILAFRLNW